MQLRRIAIIIVAMAVAFSPLIHAQPAQAASPGEFIGSINGLRASKGVGGLSVDGSLSAQAQYWAQQMANRNAISHNPALGSTGGGWVKIGENVGAGGSAGSIFNALVNSSGHYRNMVDGSFNRVGVGVAHGSDGRIYTAHVFANIPGGGGGGHVASGGGTAPAQSASARSGGTRAGGGNSARAPQGSSGGGNGGAAAPAAEQAPAPPPPPPPPAPDPQIVAGLDEVRSFLTQG